MHLHYHHPRRTAVQKIVIYREVTLVYRLGNSSNQKRKKFDDSSISDAIKKLVSESRGTVYLDFALTS